jgi:hypothetical protein
MNIVEATDHYETWLGGLTPLLAPDIKLKHDRMRGDVFSFLRATYYRWAQIWPEACPRAAKAVKVLAVGDLHVENFGTWRDVEGRLVWGINDFDECYPMAFTNDLVRLTVSAALAISEGELALTPKEACAAILRGYTAGILVGGKAFVLADNSSQLRHMARERLNTPERFWDKLRGFAPIKKSPPSTAVKEIRNLLPDPGTALKFIHRIAGLGSLGKLRFTAIGIWAGGLLAREAKAITPSACIWAAESRMRGPINYDRILRTSVRAADPMVAVCPPWLIRRLSPDCFRIELADLPKRRDENVLLYSMGWETANVHVGSGKAAEIKRNLRTLGNDWLHQAAKTMREAVVEDWERWKNG